MRIRQPGTQFEAALNRLPVVVRAKERLAHKIASRAQATSAVRTGLYRSRWAVTTVPATGVVKVVNTVFYSVFLEFGTVKMDAHEDLKRAAEPFGLKESPQAVSFRQEAASRRTQYSTRRQTRSRRNS